MKQNLKNSLRGLIGLSGLLVLTGCNTFETRAPRRAPLAYPGSPQAVRPLSNRPSGTAQATRVTPVPVAQTQAEAIHRSPQTRTGQLAQQELQANANFRNEMRMQMDQVMAENARLNTELMSLRRKQGQPHTTATATDAEVRLLKARIDGLEAQLLAVEATSKANSGQIQKIPAKIEGMLKKYQGSGTSSTRNSVAANPVRQKSKATRESGYEHVVATGETLSAIASAYEVSARKIIEANQLTDPDNLKVDQVLFIPE